MNDALDHNAVAAHGIAEGRTAERHDPNADAELMAFSFVPPSDLQPGKSGISIR